MCFRYRLLISACLIALLINSLLAYWKLADATGGIVGCSGSADCAVVFASRWSLVFGLPVAVAGVLFYMVLFATLLWERVRLSLFCYGLITGAAIWLVFVQAVILHHFCPWCMAAHGVGMLVVIVGLTSQKLDGPLIHTFLMGIAASLALPLGQLYGPVPDTSALVNLSSESRSGLLVSDVHAAGTGRKINFIDGKKIYDCSSLPIIGNADAKHVLVELFDYQCPACQRMNGYLSALVEAHPKQISILVLPVPLDHGCNPSLPESEPGHPGSCEMTRIALAVWRIKPEVYPILHRKFMSVPAISRTAARAFANTLVDDEKLDASMADPWIDSLIKADIEDWVSFAGDHKILPQLLIKGNRILHGLPSGQEDFIRVMEKELGL